MYPLLLLLLLLLPISHSANIFAGALFGGSHLSAIHDIAVILADAGHNVTLVNIVAGELDKLTKHSNVHGVHSNVHGIHPNIYGVDIIMWDEHDKGMMWRECISGLIEGDSSDAMNAFTPSCTAVWREIWVRSATVYTGNRVLEMFKSTQFDVILGEKVEFTGMSLLGTVTNVPVVNFEPSFAIQMSLLHGNLPMLITSQPSLIYTSGFDHAPSFFDRLHGVRNAVKFSPFILTAEQAIHPFLKQFGFSTLEDVKDSVKLFLTNDHPAFTFPFLRPPNDIPIGCANLLDSKNSPVQFSPEVSRFLEESEGKDVVYVSFGSYVKMSEKFSWFPKLMDILIELDLRIIVKMDKDSETKFPNSVLPLSWAPQKDLLRSGKVKLFISHCGNNGRIETIFYNVPVLCIPQFADQPICGELLKLNGFGESLMKQDVETKGKGLVSAMLANHATYHDKMKRASDIVENEPGNVKENLVFYVGHVAKYGNIDYLVNKVIQQQSLVEVNNLDILIPVCMIVLCIVVCVVYLLYKICFYLTFGLKKSKSE